MKTRPLTPTDRQIVKCRYLEGLTNRETAAKLNLGFWQIKYRVRKPNVKEYIRKHILPKLIGNILSDIDRQLEDPIAALAARLVQDTTAQTFYWDKKKKNWFDNNRRQMKALQRISAMYGLLTTSHHYNRDIQRWMKRLVSELKQKRSRILAAYKAGILDARVYQ